MDLERCAGCGVYADDLYGTEERVAARTELGGEVYCDTCAAVRVAEGRERERLGRTLL